MACGTCSSGVAPVPPEPREAAPTEDSGLIKALFRFIGGLFRFLFRALDFLRRAVLNLVLLVIIGALVVLLWSPAPELPEQAALVLRPAGALVKQERL